MAQIFLPDNGQQFELDDDIAAKDDILKEALRPIYPEIGNAKISRETVDGVLTVKVVKQAGRKGAATIESVKAPAPEAEPVMLELERIRTDGGTQTRSQIDMGVTAEYAEAMKAGRSSHRWTSSTTARITGSRTASTGMVRPTWRAGRAF
jgi:hypothetical protein